MLFMLLRSTICLSDVALPNPPRSIQACYMHICVSNYIPNPRRCFKCQKFAQGRSNCHSSAVCAKCGQPGHDINDCSTEAKCANCSGSHHAQLLQLSSLAQTQVVHRRRQAELSRQILLVRFLRTLQLLWHKLVPRQITLRSISNQLLLALA